MRLTQSIFYLSFGVSSFLMIGCGGDDGSSDNAQSPNGSSDIVQCDNPTAGGVYGAYDTGFSNGLRLGFGQMPSDINFEGIPACQEGQFIYNGTCWDSFKYDVDAFALTAYKGTTEAVLFNPGADFDGTRLDQVTNIQNGSQECDILGNRAPEAGACFVYDHYGETSTYPGTVSAPTPLSAFYWTQGEGLGANPKYATLGNSKTQYLSLAMIFGFCETGPQASVQYDVLYKWNYNSTLVMNGKEYPSPITFGMLKDAYGSNLIQAPVVEDGICQPTEPDGSSYCHYIQNGDIISMFNVQGGANATDDSAVLMIILDYSSYLLPKNP